MSGDFKVLVGYFECGCCYWCNDYELCYVFVFYDEYILFKWVVLVEKDYDVIEELLEVMMKEVLYVVIKCNICVVEGSNGVCWCKFFFKEKGFFCNYVMYVDMVVLDW